MTTSDWIGVFALGLLAASASKVSAVILVPEDHATITLAVAAAPSGETIVVSGGPYTEMVTISAKSLAFISSPEGAVWNGSGTHCVIADTGAYATFQGFVFQGASSIGLEANAAVISMENCVSHLHNHGAAAFFGGSVIADNCMFNDNGTTGIIATSGGHLIVRNSTMIDNTPGTGSGSHGGSRLDNSGTTGLYENCLVIGDRVNGDRAYGFLQSSGPSIIARNNVIMGPTFGFDVGSSATLVATGNVFINCATGVRGNNGSTVNLGNLGNIPTDDDGGNVFLTDNLIFFSNSGATSIIAEGNIYPRIESTYLMGKILGAVDHSPAFQVSLDRVSVNPAPGDFSVAADGHFVEVRAFSDVTSSQPISLKGWVLSDDPDLAAGDEGAFTIPAGAVVAPGESLLLASNLAAVDDHYGTIPGLPAFGYGGVSPEVVFDPSGDEVLLAPLGAGILDAFLYGAGIDTVPSENWTGSRKALAAQGMIYGRDDLGTDTDTEADWTDGFVTGRVALTTGVVGLFYH